MKTIISSFLVGFVAMLLFSCDKNDDSLNFPKVYTFKSFEIRSSQYVRLNQSGWESILPAGNFARLESFILNEMPITEPFLLKEISLLDESTVKFTFENLNTGITSDSTVDYTTQGNELDIQWITDPSLIEFSDDKETLELCNFIYYHTILSSQFPQVTDSPIVNDYCTSVDGVDPVGYVKDQFDWIPGDTVATIFSAWVYELE